MKVADDMSLDNTKSPANPEIVTEAEIYRRLLRIQDGPRSGRVEELRTTPLMTLSAKDAIEKNHKNRQIHGPSGSSNLFSQYAVLGFHQGCHPHIADQEPILMNVDAPNSAFICGSQGSGKSYTLSCMLENCLAADDRIGRLHRPLAGIAFHYNTDSRGAVAETAYLCSLGVRVNVLVSRSNEYALRAAYNKIPNAKKHLSIVPLLLHQSDLSIDRMNRLMAFAGKETSMPLYMAVVLRVLRHMAADAKGGPFDYAAFKKALTRERLSQDQWGPLNLRLELLESFLDFSRPGASKSSSLFHVECGTLTIIDLTDPFMDPATACTLFEICLSLVKEKGPSCGMVVVLDEAHKYMTSSPAASHFTDRLLGTIREQRHNATRMIIATQEPTISEKLLDLCTVSIVHRFASPAWFASIQGHLSGAKMAGHSISERYELFERIMDLEVGEGLLFAPSSFLCVERDGNVAKLGGVAITMKTRARLGVDGGMSILASQPANTAVHETGSNGQRAHSMQAPTHGIGSMSPVEQFRVGALSLRDPVDEAIRGVPIQSDNPLALAGHQMPFLNTSRSHLTLICCSCNSLLLVEFASESLPNLTHKVQVKLDTALAYATCVTCQLQHVRESKTASRKFDSARGKKFSDGEININEDLEHAACSALRTVLGREVIIMHHDFHRIYLFLGVIQRVIEQGDSIYNMRFACVGNVGCGINLSVHRDGDFFKSSLRPSAGNN